MSVRTALRPGELSPTLPVPKSIARPEYAWRPTVVEGNEPWVQTPEVIEKMRVAGRIAAGALVEAARTSRDERRIELLVEAGKVYELEVGDRGAATDLPYLAGSDADLREQMKMLTALKRDIEAAAEIANQIETELTYPGQIKVTVVRESRATDVAR